MGSVPPMMYRITLLALVFVVSFAARFGPFTGGQELGSAPPPPAVNVGTLTFANTAATASPNPTPHTTYEAFTRGDVPTGSVAVPQLCNPTCTDLATWQADAQVYWDDGSLMGASYSFLLPSITGSGTTQITFGARAGSWPAASTKTLSDVTTGSDYKLALSNLHTAQIYAAGAANANIGQFGLTLSGGSVSGCVVHWLTNLPSISNSSPFLGTFNAQQGSSTVVGGVITATAATPASITVSKTAPNCIVNSGGSGYRYLGTDGHFCAGVNQAATIYGTNGNHNGVRIDTLASGPAKLGLRVMMPVQDCTSGAILPHEIAIFYVEYWTDASNNLLATRATSRLTNSSDETTNKFNNYTFDADWKNGTTVIRGVAVSTPHYNTIMQYAFSGFYTLHDGGDGGLDGIVKTGLLDWSTNDTSYNRVIQQRTPGEIDQLWHTGLIPPQRTTYNGAQVGSNLINWASGCGNARTGFGVSNPPTDRQAWTQASYLGSTVCPGDDLTTVPLIQPMGLAGIRFYETGGGSAHNESLFADNATIYHLALKQGYTTSAISWLAIMRGAAANFTSGANVSPALDATSLWYPSTFPAAEKTFGGIPDRSARDWGAWSLNGYTNGILHGGSGSGSIGASMSPIHLPRHAYPAYIFDGEAWERDETQWLASNCMYSVPANASNQSYIRKVTVGSTLYDGLFWSANTRAWVWCMAAVAQAAKIMPTTFADGSINYEQQWLEYVLRHNLAFVNTVQSFVGDITPTSGYAHHKGYDWTGSGVIGFTMLMGGNGSSPPATLDGDEWPFDIYLAQVMPFIAWLWQDHGSGNGIADAKIYLNEIMTSLAGRFAFTGSHYMTDLWWFQQLQGPNVSYPPITHWQTADNTKPGWPEAGVIVESSPGNYGGNTSFGVSLNFPITGNSTVEITAHDTASYAGMSFAVAGQTGYPSNTYYADGSAIMFTIDNIGSVGGLSLQSLANPVCTNTGNASLPITGSPFNITAGTWYYIRSITPAATGRKQQITIHQSKADALANVNPFVPSMKMCNIQIYGAPSNPLPADNSGAGFAGYKNSTGSIGYCASTLGAWSIAIALGYTAPGDSTMYPAVDTVSGVSNAMSAALNTSDTYCKSIAGWANFVEEPLFALSPTRP